MPMIQQWTQIYNIHDDNAMADVEDILFALNTPDCEYDIIPPGKEMKKAVEIIKKKADKSSYKKLRKTPKLMEESYLLDNDYMLCWTRDRKNLALYKRDWKKIDKPEQDS